MTKIKHLITKKSDYLKSLKRYQSGQFRESLHKKIRSQNLKDKREIDYQIPHSTEIVFSTYFTSKKDPQRDSFNEASNFQYIESWYKSVVNLSLKAIVFIDFLDEDFIKKYTNENVKFVYCKLGSLSLNDERFFIYYDYTLKYDNQIKRCLFTDINDVVFLKSPFELIKQDSQKLFVGRNDTNLFIHSPFNEKKLERFEKELNVEIPTNFYHQPIYNAGIIGGSIEVVLLLIHTMTEIFIKHHSENNYNMLVLNIAIFKCFYPRSINNFVVCKLYPILGLRYSIIVYKFWLRLTKNKKWVDEEYTENLDDRYGKSYFIETSFPLNNGFKSFKLNGGEYLKHK